jgi:uncharacterized SAM-binding protein YcdF (DUF218 family)
VRDPPGIDARAGAAGGAAFVVLGCRVALDGQGRLQGTLRRRVEVAAEGYARGGEAQPVVIASGGRCWSGVVEADAMARELVQLGVPQKAIVRERCSLSTRDNARFAGEALARRGITRVTLVTCAWHLPRATVLFGRQGLHVEGLASPGGRTPWRGRIWRWGRERFLTWALRLRP